MKVPNQGVLELMTRKTKRFDRFGFRFRLAIAPILFSAVCFPSPEIQLPQLHHGRRASSTGSSRAMMAEGSRRIMGPPVGRVAIVRWAWPEGVVASRLRANMCTDMKREPAVRRQTNVSYSGLILRDAFCVSKV